jgi:serine/threonine protein kinase
MMEKTLTINTCYDMKYNISDIEKMELEHEEYAGEYEILSLLGEGGQAMVYLGNREQNKFALKVYNSGVNNLAAY